MLRHRYGSPTAFAVSCLGKEKNKIVKIFGLSLSMSIDKTWGHVISSFFAEAICFSLPSLRGRHDRGNLFVRDTRRTDCFVPRNDGAVSHYTNILCNKPFLNNWVWVSCWCTSSILVSILDK